MKMPTILKEKKIATSSCAILRTAYHNCFNRWYSEKFLKGDWSKEECVSEWNNYRDCLSKHLDDKNLRRFLDSDIGTAFKRSSAEAEP